MHTKDKMNVKSMIFFASLFLCKTSFLANCSEVSPT